MVDRFEGFTKVNIKTLTLMSLSSKKMADIKSIVTQIEIFGSIFSPTIVGSLVVNDGSSLIQNFPVIGEELLEIEFESPGRKPFRKLMHVFYPENNEFDPNGTHVNVTLHFATVDDFQGKLAYINQGYKTNISDIVSGVLTNYTGTKQPLNFEQTKGIELINIPGWNAWKTIEFLRARSVSPRYNSPYLFFEDQTGYNFVSYEHLINQRKSKASELRFTADSFLPEAGEDEVGKSTVLQRQYRNVDQLIVEDKSNTMKLAHEGGASSRTVVFDILNKSIRNVDTTYDDVKSIVKVPIGKQFNPSHTADLFKTKVPTRTYLMPFDSTNPHALVDQYGKKNMYVNIISETKVSWTTPGDSELQPGDVIYFEAPGRVNSKDPDKQLTGNYLIGNLRHGISDGQMFTTVDTFKCGFEEKIV